MWLLLENPIIYERDDNEE